MEELSKRERKMYELLNEEKGRTIKIEKIIEEIYEIEADEGSKNAVRLMISRINYKIRRSGKKIINRKGIGYYIDEKEEYKRRGKVVNHYKDIKQISNEELREIIRNLRK